MDIPPRNLGRDPRYSGWLLQSVRTGLLAVDDAGILCEVSPEALDILRIQGTPESWLGEPASRLLAPEPELLDLLAEAMAGRAHAGRSELRLQSEPRRIGFTLVSVHDERGEGQGAALLFRDLTPFESEAEQAKLQDRLAALGEMAAGLAHEIRNPLAAMEVLAGLLKRRLEDGESQELLDDLLTGQREIAAVVDASLEYVRPTPPTRCPVSLASLLREAFEIARRRISTPVELVLPVDESLVGDLDPGLIRRALVDLLVNALQALHESATPHPKVWLRAETLADGGTQIEVQDNGPGIPQEAQLRIFQPFFTTRDRGSGIGLANVQKVVSAHGGTIEHVATLREGTCFRLCLPAAEPEAGTWA